MLPPAHDPVDPVQLWEALTDRSELASVLAEIRTRLWRTLGSPGLDADSAVRLTGSGTEALDLALRVATGSGDPGGASMAGHGRGRTGAGAGGAGRVALPAWGCYALASAAVGAGVEVLYYDLDPATLAADPESVGRALENGARAVVLVHYYGYPGVTPDTLESIRSAGAVVVEDAAQRSGGTLRGRPLGSLGDLSVLSFGRGKGLTCGGGGALLLRSPALAGRFSEVTKSLRDASRAGSGDSGSDRSGSSRAGSIREAGGRAGGTGRIAKTALQWLFGRPSLYRVPASLPFLGLGETHYVPPAIPAPLPELPARLLRLVLDERAADDEIARRYENARRLEALIEGSGALAVRPVPEGDAGHLRLPVLLPARGSSSSGARGAPRPPSSTGAPRWEPGAPDGFAPLGIVQGYPRLLRELGVVDEAAPALRTPTPGADSIRACLVTLPTHGLLRAEDLAVVARWVHGKAAPDERRDPAPASERHVERMEG